MRLKIAHTTHYQYGAPVPFGLQQLRMVPKTSHGQSIIEWSVDVEGSTREAQYVDHHNNQVQLFSIDEESQEVVVTCKGEIDTSDTAGTVGPHVGPAPLWYYLRDTEMTRIGPGIEEFIAGFSPRGDQITRLHALSAAIIERVAYETGRTHSATTAEEALAAGHGVCQDHSHLFCAVARRLGFPARYVTGYLMMDDRVDQEAGHAWAEAHVDALGWVGFDVSNGISPDPRYVRVATGLDARQAAPISGLTIGATSEEKVIVNLQVQQ